MLMSRSIGVALAGLVALAAAAVAQPSFKYTDKSCSLEGTVLPEIKIPGWEQLPRPQTATPLVVVVGRGTQNYTCESEQSAPKLQGAVALLFDESCLARHHPRALNALPAQLLAYSPESLRHRRHGYHFFNAAGTAMFDMSRIDGGVFAVAAVAASVKGPPTTDHNMIRPAVNWVEVTAVAGSTKGFRQGFRVVTAGGTAPESCWGMPAHFEVQYAAQYWFY